jgi:nucleoid-associated protein YgaU
VKSGDSLSEIAQQHYGDGKKWRAIFEANRDLITNPDLIHPGQVLKIPSIGDDTP